MLLRVKIKRHVVKGVIMSHPEWVLKHKLKNTEIRNIRGRYYLYKITSKWDPEKKRTKKVTLGMLGTITEKDGFIPKGQSKKGKPKKQSIIRDVSVKEYGATMVLQHLSTDIIEMLKEVFPDDWQTLFTIATNRLIYQAPLKNCEFLYEESFLSETFKDIKINKNNLTDLLQKIGSSRENIAKFMGKFVEGSEHILFDATHIISQSNNVKSAQKGYNGSHNYDPQVNLFYMFNQIKKEPNYYRVFPGNIQGMSALKLCLEESNAKNCIAIGDKGFCSEKNLNLLENAHLQYILPLRRDSKLIDYQRLESRLYVKAFDGHFIYQDRAIFYTNLEEKDGKKIIIFTDKSLALEEEKNYLKRINQGYEGYDMATYQEKQMTFGTIAMISNCLNLHPEQVYLNYKSRMEIETVFDIYKNLLVADRTYMRSDSSMEAWIFINHIAIMMYYRIFNLLKAANMINSVSPSDLLQKLARINKLKINSSWLTSEMNAKTFKLIQKLNLHVTCFL